jgi:hypothetical protein
MTRKDYELIAQAFRTIQRKIGVCNLSTEQEWAARASLNELSLYLGSMLQAENNRFNIALFIERAGTVEHLPNQLDSRA